MDMCFWSQNILFCRFIILRIEQYMFIIRSIQFNYISKLYLFEKS